MKSISILFAILAIFIVTSAFAKKTEMPVLPKGFQLDTIINGRQALNTPFAEFPVVKFINIAWDPMKRILKMDIGEGEERRISQTDDDIWFFARYLNGEQKEGYKLTWVGPKMAAIIASQLVEVEISIFDSMLIVTGDDSTFLWEERLPEGMECRVIRENRWLLFSLSPNGKRFLKNSLPFGSKVEKSYIALYPMIFISDKNEVKPAWGYVVGGNEWAEQSGFGGPITDSIDDFLK